MAASRDAEKQSDAAIRRSLRLLHDPVYPVDPPRRRSDDGSAPGRN